MKDDDNHILLLEKGKRGLVQIIFGRTGIIIVSLIVQILFLFAAFYKLEGFLPYFWGGNTLLSAAVVLFLFGNDDNPTIKLTWFFILAVLPVFGLILYVYIKTDLGHRLMIRRYNDILSQTEHFAPSESACSKEELPEELQSLASYLNSCGFPCYQNTQAQYFPLGDDAFEVMCDELQKAEHFIFLEYFIVREGYMWGRILEILKEKVNAGIEVRVLYDGTCAVALLPYSYPEKLEKLGIAPARCSRRCARSSPRTTTTATTARSWSSTARSASQAASTSPTSTSTAPRASATGRTQPLPCAATPCAA